MAIIVFQHGEHEHPGRLGATLRDHGFRLDIRRLDVLGGAGIPPDLDDVHGAISLGGEQNITAEGLARHPWLEREAAFLRDAHAAQLPVIGICLGAQLVAHALGGEVGVSPSPECGFETVSINTAGQVEPILAGIAWRSPQFQSHSHEVSSLPGEATLLASSERCRVQAFKAGLRTLGFQYHFECDRGMIESLAGGGLSAPEIAAQCDRHYAAFARLGDRLCVNIASYCFPLARRLTA